jgi:hypothetical protein
MPPKTLEEIYEEKTGKKTKIPLQDIINDIAGWELNNSMVYSSDFVEWLIGEYKFLGYRLEGCKKESKDGS